MIPNADGGDAAIRVIDERYQKNAKTYFINKIIHARKSIDLTMYQLDDDEIILALIGARTNGVVVRIITELKNAYSHEKNLEAQTKKAIAIEKLSRAGIELRGLPKYIFEKSPKQSQVHSKLLVVDEECAVIMSCNWDEPTLRKTRDFGVVFDEKEIIRMLRVIFDSDWSEIPLKQEDISLFNKIPATNIPQLIVGPDDNQREIFINLCKLAKKSIRIYNQSFNDEKFVQNLCKLIKPELKVELLMLEYPFSSTKNANFVYQEMLKQSGGLVYFNDERYIHAKVIIVDDSYAYIGSCNIYEPSFLFNRELGWITTNKKIIEQLIVSFEKDKLFCHNMP